MIIIDLLTGLFWFVIGISALFLIGFGVFHIFSVIDELFEICGVSGLYIKIVNSEMYKNIEIWSLRVFFILALGMFCHFLGAGINGHLPKPVSQQGDSK